MWRNRSPLLSKALLGDQPGSAAGVGLQGADSKREPTIFRKSGAHLYLVLYMILVPTHVPCRVLAR